MAGGAFLWAVAAGPAAAQVAATCTNTNPSPLFTNTLWECVLKVDPANGGLASDRSRYLTRLKAKFTYGTETRSTYAFWDGQDANGKQRFVIRMKFPWEGPGSQTWTWNTECDVGDTTYCPAGKASPSLIIGSTPITVTSAPTPVATAPPNLPFLGDITTTKVTWGEVGQPNREWVRLTQKNRPFVWVGDTAWAATLRATFSEWQAYLTSRTYSSTISPGVTKTENSASVIHLAMAPNWACTNSATCAQPTDRSSNKPFLPANATGIVPNASTTPNMPFWQGLDAKIKEANNRGFYVFLAGVMGPSAYHANAGISAEYPATDEALFFARWLAARMSGSFVILSPGFDTPKIDRGADILQDKVGAEIKKVAPHLLVTNHWSTNSITEMASLHGKPWLDFEMVQSGHNEGDLVQINGRAREMSQQVSGSITGSNSFTTQRKATINGEAIYDHGVSPFNDFWTRAAGYLSWLSGASGYTFGVGGTWDWGYFASQMGSGYGAGNYANPHNMVDQMKHMGNFIRTYLTSSFNAYEQSRILKIWPERLNEQYNILPYKAALVRHPTGMLVYLPASDKVRVRHAGTGINVNTAKLYNPAKGTQEWVSSASGSHVYCPPNQDYCEWDNRFFQSGSYTDRVLNLTTSPAATWFVTDDRNLDVFVGRFGETDPIAVHAAELDASGIPNGESKVIAAVEGQEPSHPAFARDGKGMFLVVWQTDSDFDGRQEIWGRRYDVRQIFRISPDDGLDHSEPAVGMNRPGQAVVSWTVKGDGLANSQVMARAWNKTSGLGSSAIVCSSPGVDCSGSKVAASPEGLVSVAWLETDAALEEERVMIQRYPADLVTFQSSTPSSQQVNAIHAGGFWIRHLNVDSDGQVAVEYEARTGTIEGALFMQAFDQDGVKSGGENQLEGPYEEQ